MAPTAAGQARASRVFGTALLIGACLAPVVASGQAPVVDDAEAATSSVEADAPSAETEDPRKTQAREALRLAAQLAAQGQWVEALGAYERSASLWPHPTTTYNIAFSERALGRYTRSMVHFQRALADPTLRQQLRVQAEAFVTQVGAQVARVSVTLPDPAMRIAVDGRPLASDAALGAPAVLLAGVRRLGPGEVMPQRSVDVLVDPGDHTFVVTPVKGADIVVLQTVAAGEHVRLRLPAAEPPTPDSGEPSPAAAEPAEAGVPAIAIAGFATAGVGLVVGIITGSLALSTAASAEEQCDAAGFCPQGVGDDIDRGFALANAANVSFAVAGAATVVGVVGWLVAEPAETESALEVGFGLGAVHVRGQF